jgi:hypothetical protein
MRGSGVIRYDKYRWTRMQVEEESLELLLVSCR